MVQVLLLVRCCCYCKVEKARSRRCNWMLCCRIAVRRVHRASYAWRRRRREPAVLLHRREHSQVLLHVLLLYRR